VVGITDAIGASYLEKLDLAMSNFFPSLGNLLMLSPHYPINPEFFPQCYIVELEATRV
jgi:hypothetical protein